MITNSIVANNVVFCDVRSPCLPDTNGVFNTAGGLLNEGTVTIVNSTLSGNTVSCAITFSFGGSCLNTAAVNANSFTFNAGGGIMNEGTATILRSAIIGNSVSCTDSVTDDIGPCLSSISIGGGGILNRGGGMHAGAATLRISNSTLSANLYRFSNNVQNASRLAGIGAGGIANTDSVTIGFSTIAQNSVVCAPMVCYAGFANTGAIAIKSTIVANTVSGRDCYNSSISAITSQGYNLSTDGSCANLLKQASDLTTTDPKLGPLADNGGSTETIALLPGSPAIDAVPTADCTDTSGNPVTTDQRGVSRPQGTACDIGAFELQQK
jgi:hypothetical protein